ARFRSTGFASPLLDARAAWRNTDTDAPTLSSRDPAVKKLLLGLAALLCTLVPLARPAQGPGDAPKAAFPRFRVQEIETGLKVGYAVLPVDVNHDGKPDVVVVDTTRVVWYENPTWKRRTIIQNQTKP